jgi:hypothetical protein
MDSAFNWVISNHGLASETEYPYISGTGVTGKCSAKKRKFSEVQISKVCDVVAKDEGDLEKAVAQQASYTPPPRTHTHTATTYRQNLVLHGLESQGWE